MGGLSALANRENIPRFMIARNEKNRINRDPANTPMKTDQLRRVYATGLHYVRSGSIRHHLIAAGFASRSIVNISFITKSILELVVHQSIVNGLQDQFRASGIHILDGYRPDKPANPAAPPAIHREFLEGTRRRLTQIINASKNMLARTYFQEWLQSLPAQRAATGPPSESTNLTALTSTDVEVDTSSGHMQQLQC